MGERASREALPEIVGLGEGNQMRAGRKERNVIDSSEEEEKVLGRGQGEKVRGPGRGGSPELKGRRSW